MAKLSTLRLSPLPMLFPPHCPRRSPCCPRCGPPCRPCSSCCPCCRPRWPRVPWSRPGVPPVGVQALPGRAQGHHPVQGLRSQRCRFPRLTQPPQRSPQQEGTCCCWTWSCHWLRSSSNQVDDQNRQLKTRPTFQRAELTFTTLMTLFEL